MLIDCCTEACSLAGILAKKATKFSFYIYAFIELH